MRFLLRLFLVLVLVVLLVLIHMASVSLLPYPLNAINTVMAVCLLIMVWKEDGLVVWVSFGCHFIIELYTKTPFGVLLTAGTVSLLLGYWLYGYIFSNQSWYAALALSAMVMVMYRSIYTIGIFLTNFFTGHSQVLSWALLNIYLFELLLTSFFVVFVWIVTGFRGSRPSPKRYFFGYGS